MTIDIGAIRDKLNRTGALQTWDPEGLGHVSDFWRGRVNELCDALEVAPTGGAVELEEAKVQKLIDVAQRSLFVPDAWSRALWLLEEARPRMKTLNNAASARWLQMYAEFTNEER